MALFGAALASKEKKNDPLLTGSQHESLVARMRRTYSRASFGTDVGNRDNRRSGSLWKSGCRTRRSKPEERFTSVIPSGRPSQSGQQSQSASATSQLAPSSASAAAVARSDASTPCKPKERASSIIDIEVAELESATSRAADVPRTAVSAAPSAIIPPSVSRPQRDWAQVYTFEQDEPIGIALANMGSMVIAFEVENGSEAHRKGVRIGSLLQQVNDTDVQDWDAADVRKLVAASGRPMRLWLTPLVHMRGTESSAVRQNAVTWLTQAEHDHGVRVRPQPCSWPRPSPLPCVPWGSHGAAHFLAQYNGRTAKW